MCVRLLSLFLPYPGTWHVFACVPGRVCLCLSTVGARDRVCFGVFSNYVSISPPVVGTRCGWLCLVVYSPGTCLVAWSSPLNYYVYNRDNACLCVLLLVCVCLLSFVLCHCSVCCCPYNSSSWCTTWYSNSPSTQLEGRVIAKSGARREIQPTLL